MILVYISNKLVVLGSRRILVYIYNTCNPNEFIICIAVRYKGFNSVLVYIIPYLQSYRV